MILRQMVKRCTLRNIDLNILGKQQDLCPLSSRIFITQPWGRPRKSVTGPFPHRSPCNAWSSFLNYVWPAVSTPDTGLFNLLVHPKVLMNQVQPSIWLICGHAVNLWKKKKKRRWKGLQATKTGKELWKVVFTPMFAKQGEGIGEFIC